MKSRLALLFAALLLLPAQLVYGVPQDSACRAPVGLQKEITVKYPNTHIVTLADLGQDDRSLFLREHGSDCPGLARVDFYGDGRPTFALILLSSGSGNRQARLIVATGDDERWKLESLESLNGVEVSPVPVVWTEKPGKYDDAYGEKTVNSKNPVIVLCGYESWAILYAWSGKAVEKIWIHD